MNRKRRKYKNDKRKNNIGVLIGIIFLIIMFYFIIWLVAKHIGTIEKFNEIFLGMIEKAIPFIIIGVVISEVMENFINGSNIYNIIPQSRGLALITASIIGLICPVFKENIVDFCKGLIKNKVPSYIAITFMLSVPIINPITILSTFLAFSNDIGLALLRVIGTTFIAISIGYIFSFFRFQIIKSSFDTNINRTKHSYIKSVESAKVKGVMVKSGLRAINILKYFVAASAVAAFIQILMPYDIIMDIQNKKLLSLVVVMLMAYFMNVSSEADAFIAASLLNIFTSYSVVTFLIFGAMIDVKNTILMRKYFTTEFIVVLISLLLIFNIIFSYILSYIVI